MSLLGIDVGSSATKVVAFHADGTLLAEAREDVEARHTQPGWWEVDATAVLAATVRVVRQVAASEAVRRDPPSALAVSASGREVVPVSPTGVPLGPCLRTADRRAAILRAGVDGDASPDHWVDSCGHVPDHMDPLNRLLWWREDSPEVYAQADRFLGWHELLTLRLCGRAVTDPSLAGKWFAYDLRTGTWSPALLEAWRIDSRLLPEIESWGTRVGVVGEQVAAELSLPEELVVAVGGFDTSCAALGSGASRPGVPGLVVGSWESLVVPVERPPSARDLIEGRLAVGPHPGGSELGVFALSPNGTVVVDRIRDLTGLSILELDAELEASGPGPSPVLAIPHLSGATNPWKDGARSEGAVIGMSLATSRADLVKAFMEGIAFDLALTFDRLRDVGAPADVIRATGGGARSAWWMQLKADLTGVPIEVVDQPEAGALGAAMLAGLADGTYSSLQIAIESLVRPSRRYEPNGQRVRLYAERVEAYRASVEALLPLYPPSGGHVHTHVVGSRSGGAPSATFGGALPRAEHAGRRFRSDRAR